MGLADFVRVGLSMFGFKPKNSPNTPKVTSSNDLASGDKPFEIIFNTIDDGVILLDNKQTIRKMNPGAATILGWPVEEAININIQSIVKLVNDKAEPIGDQDNPLSIVYKLQEAIHDVDAILARKDGKQTTISLSLNPLFDDRNQLTAVVAIMRDISKQRSEEQQRDDFISTASHEMRTPVAAIEGYLALALNDKVATIDNRARDYIDKAHESTQHLGQLFQDLLTSSKAEDGRLISHPSVVEIGEFLEKVSEDLRFSAEKKGLIMEFKIGSSAIGTIDASKPAGNPIHNIRPKYYVYVDPDRLREVITNLFDNAVKYTPEGKVILGVNGDDHVVQCYVKDTGPGIPPADVPHLFQKFYRVDNSATRTIGGTGLGLFICKKIIELYNGRIWAESEQGQGTSFFINLPRLSDQKAEQLKITHTVYPSEKGV